MLTASAGITLTISVPVPRQGAGPTLNDEDSARFITNLSAGKGRPEIARGIQRGFLLQRDIYAVTIRRIIAVDSIQIDNSSAVIITLR
ncbi:TPA: hypothetical protein QDZ66_002452 [Pluralibacter gergoviae]|uniref:hypothetical protein n=1 Tax=Pluralibacter gergoviae TaxID=61647 RepID=UPI0012D49230|nr:hypothetical protein [Pluralibacter gergoviae]MBL3693774.1 hypothetical protein [Pluralibacter gergoviae]HDS1151692.1 hypothetical protein [Pluralibacter gergoviae]